MLLVDPQSLGVGEGRLFFLIHGGQRRFAHVAFRDPGRRPVQVLRREVASDLLGTQLAIELAHGEDIEDGHHLGVVRVPNLGKIPHPVAEVDGTDLATGHGSAEASLVQRLGFDPAMARFSGLVALDRGSFRCSRLVWSQTSAGLKGLGDRGVAGRPLQGEEVLVERRERSLFAGRGPGDRRGSLDLTGALKRRLLVVASRLPHALI